VEEIKEIVQKKRAERGVGVDKVRQSFKHFLGN
jgi:hypothetical protein